MSGHTPGPWNYDDNEGYGPWQIFTDGQRLIAQVVGDSAKTEANVRLISAAPELLDAVKNLLWEVEGLTGDDAVDCSPYRALIAKAEGREVAK